MPDHFDSERADQLIKKYIAGQCTPEEKVQVEAWYNELHDEHMSSYERADLGKVEAQLDKRILSRPQKINLIRPYIAAAAAILIFLSIGLIWYFQSQETFPSPQLTSQYGDDILPGGNRATITLADGRTIDLDSASIGLLAQEQGADITKSEDGTITYEVQGNGLDAGSSAFNTIATPRGGQYRITLPDGTKVWLNAASSLKYPTSFTGKERQVELVGEGYFDVIPNAKQPFVVQSDNQQVMVLGTQFNVNTYAEQRTHLTTLVEGRVSVHNTISDEELVIEANQQVVNSGKKLIKRQVNAGDYTAWKDNYFQFSGAELSDAIKQLERWYDLEVDYAAIPEGKLYARINRDRKLSTILFTIEKTSGIKFRIEGRRLTIQQ